MAGEGLRGSRRVRAIRPALDEVKRMFRKCKHQMEVRSHSLKLRYFPEKAPVDDAGKVLDLDWCWVSALRELRIAELRIEDPIGGHENLRVIFYEGDKAVRDPLPMIWILKVMAKKRNDFSANDLKIFRARRTLVIERFYKDQLN